MRFTTLPAILGLPLLCLGQWSTDPANPMVVCDAANGQRNIRAISDGGTGWYVFWSDLRVNNDKGQLYGQHFDAAGVAQWATNGQLILDLPGRSVNEFAPVLRPGGDVIIAVHSSASATYGADTVRAYRIDDQANMLWSQPALLSVSGQGIFGNCFGFSVPKGIGVSDGAYFCYHGDSQGSNGYYVMQRVRDDGTAAFTVPGIAVPFNAGYGPHEVQPDGNNGMYVAWRCSGGAGTCHRAMRVDSAGTPGWAANLDVAAGGGGLAYAFTTLADGTSGVISVWEETGGDLGMAHFDTSGTQLWTPAPVYACSESHGQATPATTMSGGSLYVAWSDGRPPASNADLYMQKIDPLTGQKLWATDGVPVTQSSSYAPIARIVPTPDGAIGIMDFTGTVKYCAMRMNSDGTPAWIAPASFATANMPYYGERMEFADGEGGVVAFWQTYGGDLFGARIYPDGEVGDHIGISEISTEGVQLSPNPASDRFFLQWPNTLNKVTVRALASDGRVIGSWSSGTGHSFQMDVTTWPQGCYVVRIDHAGGVISKRFIKH